jgi:hypothetical protein
MLIAVDQETDFVIATMPVNKYMNNSQKMLNSFSHRLIDSEVCPEIILVKNDMTRDFFDEFCTKLDITIYKTNQLPAFENAKADLFEHISEDLGKANEASMKDELNYVDMKSDLTELFRNLQALGEDENGDSLDDNQFNDFLDLMFDSIADVKEPPKKAVKQKKSAKKPKAQKSYTISVSLGTGCYRHIQISDNNTLADLHEIIQKAFNFDNSHLYAFFMDNKIWSKGHSYVSNQCETGDNYASDYTLANLNLAKGDKFKYLFDFGDEWKFQCKVLGTKEETPPKPFIIKIKGKAPKQYPYWDGKDW